MRLRVLLPIALLILASGCSGPKDRAGGADGNDQAAAAGSNSMADAPMDADAKPVRMQAVQDDVAFSGTLGASACWFDGNEVSCANVAGSNVVAYAHDRTGELTGGHIVVAFTLDAGSGPYAVAYIAEDCPDTCRPVADLADGRPELVPGGATGTFEFDLPAATILANQTLVVRVAPLLLSSLASASPTYDIDVTGTLDFLVPEA